MVRLVPCTLAVVLLLGCTTQRVTVYPLAHLDGRVPSQQVDVYAHPDSLVRPYHEIAILSATAEEPVYAVAQDHPKLIQALRTKAQEIGADAIVVFESYDPSLVGGGDRPKSTARIDRAAEARGENKVPSMTAPWTIRVKAIVYE